MTKRVLICCQNKDIKLTVSYLRHLGFIVSSQEGKVVNFILDHKILLFSFEILETNAKER